MRQGYNNSIIYTDDRDFLGVNLGSDYCAEHEWGTNKIKLKFGINGSLLGIDGRKVSKVPNNLAWIENYRLMKNPRDNRLWCGIYFDYDIEKPYVNAVSYDDKCDLISAWDGSSFAVISCNQQNVKLLKQLYNAFQNNDVLMWLGGGGVFKNCGLCFGIASKFPKQIADEWMCKDIENNKLMSEFKSTGIEDKLNAADKRYFALKPHRDANGSLKFWLNPVEQNKYNFGWFNLEDLEAWAQGKGPIIKQ